METIQGTTPGRNVERILDIWLGHQSGHPELHFWVHAPAAGPKNGWEIQIAPDQLFVALRRLGVSERTDNAIPRS